LLLLLQLLGLLHVLLLLLPPPLLLHCGCIYATRIGCLLLLPPIQCLPNR
jgi:hypothetical protein